MTRREDNKVQVLVDFQRVFTYMHIMYVLCTCILDFHIGRALYIIRMIEVFCCIVL